MNSGGSCAECGTVIPAESPGGFCLQCLFKLGLEKAGAPSDSDAEAGGHERKTEAAAPRRELPGDRVGRYRLLEEIGCGGCGVVYMAEQVEPVRRRVAVKVIKLGMDTKEFVARFDAERQALALMDHPNIAKVFDAGATDTGRPYFVMELVRGIKITEFCDENKLSTEERLKLFILVCQAIQHAHQKGVIHRDIKPSNILVTVNDGVPVPKVIDFGIAKATAGRLTDQTLFTAFEQFIGTPAYMSPEQAVMTSLDVDTRSDIYSLGVLLYQLLTDRTPFDGQELLKAGLDEMRRVIREVEPVKPSTRLTQERLAMGSSANSAKSAIRNPQSAIDKDLDWIVMKCLEKDRTRRYETANGLAMDLRRYLQEEPVLAGPPTARYRAAKFARKHRAALVAAVSFVLLLGTAAVVTTLLWVNANQERKRAQTARTEAIRNEQEARRSAAEAATLLNLIENKVLADAHLLGPGHPNTLKSLDDLAKAYLQVDRFADAERLYRQNVVERRRMFGPNHPSLVGDLYELGNCLLRQGKYPDAEAVLQECLAITERGLADEWIASRARALLGAALLGQKKYPTAEPLLLQGYDGLIQGKSRVAGQVVSLYIKEAGERLVQLYTEWGKPAQAEEWRKKLPESGNTPTAAPVAPGPK